LVTLALGFILGPLAEKAFLQSLMISEGSFLIFFKNPISIFLIILILITLSIPFISRYRGKTKGVIG
jgi:putative tricarboxylic transport membrane protein